MRKKILNENIINKNLLFLQGPLSYFFDYIQLYFKIQGANNMYQFAFNGGDEYFANKENIIIYKDRIDEYYFKPFIENFIIEKEIDTLFLLGEHRKHHEIAIKIAKKLNVTIIVFEEGYIRPNFITMEKNGVNANSNFKQKFNKIWNRKKTKLIEPIILNKMNSYNVDKRPSFQFFNASIYSIMCYLKRKKYKYYIHHKNINPFQNAFWGIRSFIRKKIYKITEKKYLYFLNNKDFFLIPLQVYNDFQITHNSKYKNIEEFIIEVLNKYKEASVDEFLVFKHHPMDRGITNYKNIILKESRKLGIENKIIYIHDLHLPTLIKSSKGIITINSTVGISALYHKKPVLTRGENTLYDIEGITNFNKNYIEFFNNPIKPNNKKFNFFYNTLIEETQIYGDFYRKVIIF